MKIDPVIYKKLLAQAEEAKEQGFTKLSSNILNAIGSYPNDEIEEYSYRQLHDDILQDMWKIATRLIRYYDVKSVDAIKLDQNLSLWVTGMMQDVEKTMNVDEIIVGPIEPKVPGQN